ncbi:OmpA/MotB family protein [Enhygromyxa salina]|uniref:OmpA/MotB family protein n=1 Tax=Enhygromyxa salina TaxID=215803 RepID=UPI0011BA9710|nr:OmpA family protein [Enhygromyxa salina]
MLRSVRVSVLACALALPLFACDEETPEVDLVKLRADLDAAQADLKAAKAAQSAHAGDEGCAKELEAAQASLAEAKAKVEAQAAQIAELEGAKGSLEGQLVAKEAALEAVKALQDQLAKSLVEEIETGDIRVSQRHGYLVIDVSDKVLFAVGEAELSERGKKVITKLADSLKALPDKSVFQVGGHTDNQPIKSEEVKAKFPTNWELSAARATNVVRFLEETSGVPGERLVAAGFSQFRPVAANNKEKNRAKNRRIEIALLPPRPK